MRFLIVSAFLLSSSFLRICGSEAPAPPAPMPVATAPGMPGAVPAPVPGAVGAPPTTTAVPAAPAAPTTGAPDAVAGLPAMMPISATRFGGTVVRVGTQSVEVIPMADGQVVAYLNDEAGNPVTAPGDATVAVRLGSATQPLTLAWQETDLRFSATVTDVRLTPGPVEVTLTRGGQAQTGRAELVPVVQPPAHGGVVLAVGTYSSEIIARSDGSIVAYLNGPEGVAVVDPQIQVVANVQADSGAETPVALVFDPAQNCWTGRLAADVQIAPGPVQVAVTNAGATVEGRFEAVAPVALAAHGGTVVSAGGFGVEVVPAANGQVEAFLKDSAGAEPPPDGFEVTVNFETGPRPEPVVLVWSAPQRRFIGRVRAGVQIEHAPVQVLVVHRGRRMRGRLATLFAPPPPVVRVGPGVFPPPPVVRVGPVLPPAIGINVRPGRPGVRVDVRPPAPPSVRVDVRPPAPPSVRVDVRPPAPPGVRGGVHVEVRPPAPPAARGGVQVEVGPRPGKRRGGGGIEIRGGGGIHIGH